MNHYDWTKDFRQGWERAVELYRAGDRQVTNYPALPGIGCSAQEFYDFAEDADELDYDTALLITAARRDYFLVVQGGRPSNRRVPVEEFPAKEAELAGYAWLPRIIVKARCKLRGELPDELMYGCGGDRKFLSNVNVHPADFLRKVWSAGENQEKIVEYVKAHAASTPATATAPRT